MRTVDGEQNPMSAPGPPLPSRRTFLFATGALAAGRTAAAIAQQTESDQELSENSAMIDERTIAEAEKLAGIAFTDDERRMMAEHVEEHLQRLRQRQTLLPIPFELSPALRFDPRLPGMDFTSLGRTVRWSDSAEEPLPRRDEDIAFAPVTTLARWIKERRLPSQRLTRIYLDRLKRFGPELECVITLTEERAMTQAREADIEIAAGKYRGPLHGIPWGAKDLFDTANIPTTWGAAPYRQRVPTEDAVVVKRLDGAGAVLVAKLSLGALAYNDIWFGGTTRNPWKREQGSSGSSAGSAAATAAGLVGFTLGTETYGSIVSPCMRCGPTGLRPTFGRVARTGAMPLCWSLDKIGPICRTAEDCALVLATINGADDGDPSSLEVPFSFDAERTVAGLRVGYAPAWFEGEAALEMDRQALQTLIDLGMKPVQIELPDWPYDTLLNVIFAESAAAFEELTRSGRDDELVWQDPEAWPNSFRQSWFIPAVEYIQISRFRRQVMNMMAERFAGVDCVVSPSFAAHLLLITNQTGHPSITLRTGFRDDGTPYGITLVGRLFDEGTLCSIAMALERRLGVWSARPPGFG